MKINGLNGSITNERGLANSSVQYLDLQLLNGFATNDKGLARPAKINMTLGMAELVLAHPHAWYEGKVWAGAT